MKKTFFILTACCFITAQASAGFMDSYVKTEVRGGKVTFLPQRTNLGGLNDTSSSMINNTPVQRKITITPAANGTIDFTVTESGEQEMGKYTCKSGASLDFLSASRKTQRYVRYVQTPGEPVRFEAGDITPAVLEMLKDQDKTKQKKEKEEPAAEEEAGEKIAAAAVPKVRIYQANSVWEMILILPEKDFKLLTEMFASFAQETNLSDWQKKIMETLVETLRKGETLEPEDCGVLIAQLADPDYAKRVAADRQLNKMGGHLLVHLLKTDWNTLDTEQQFRLQRIRERLENESEEEDAQIYARVLVKNPQVWTAMLDSGVKTQREQAAAWLEEFLKEKIEFNTNAEPGTQKAIVDGLREKVGLATEQ